MKRTERESREREKRERQEHRTGSAIRSLPKRRSINKTKTRAKDIAKKYQIEWRALTEREHTEQYQNIREKQTEQCIRVIGKEKRKERIADLKRKQ